MPQSPDSALIEVCSRLSAALSELRFAPPVHTVYNPLSYAKTSHDMYIRRFANRGVVLFLGMNPGPFGMVQTGVPFGAVPFVRDWMAINTPVGRPTPEHPKRPVLGFDCSRIEPSGERLWGFISKNFPKAEDFFRRAFVYNYCPLAFMSDSGANLTPDKFPRAERDKLYEYCDAALAEAVEILGPRALVGIGAFAEQRVLALPAAVRGTCPILRVLHPSPASPLANKNWSKGFASSLEEAGLWPLPDALASK